MARRGAARRRRTRSIGTGEPRSFGRGSPYLAWHKDTYKMVRTSTPPGKRLKAIADPDTIEAIIERRQDGGPPRMKLSLGKELTPAALVSALVDLHNYLNTRGPTDEWDDARKWLFQ